MVSLDSVNYLVPDLLMDWITRAVLSKFLCWRMIMEYNFDLLLTIMRSEMTMILFCSTRKMRKTIRNVSSWCWNHFEGWTRWSRSITVVFRFRFGFEFGVWYNYEKNRSHKCPLPLFFLLFANIYMLSFSCSSTMQYIICLYDLILFILMFQFVQGTTWFLHQTWGQSLPWEIAKGET